MNASYAGESFPLLPTYAGEVHQDLGFSYEGSTWWRGHSLGRNPLRCTRYWRTPTSLTAQSNARVKDILIEDIIFGRLNYLWAVARTSPLAPQGSVPDRHSAQCWAYMNRSRPAQWTSFAPAEGLHSKGEGRKGVSLNRVPPNHWTSCGRCRSSNQSATE